MVDRLDGEQITERVFEVVIDDLVVVDEDVLEDGLVEATADFVAGVHVQLVGIFEQAQVGLDELDRVPERIDGGLELGGEAFALSADLAELGADLLLRDGVVDGQLQEVALLGVQALELPFELLLQCAL
ncbi:hypothetical protein [Brevibacterium pityocampae]